MNPRMPVVLAVDIGTGFIKVGLVDQNGIMHAHQTTPVRYATNIGDSDIDAWFDDICEIIADMLSSQRYTVAAIIVCGQAPTLIALNERGQIIKPVLFRSMVPRQPDTAHLAGDSAFLPCARWFHTRYPNQYRAVRQWLPLPEYITYRLGGAYRAMLPTPAYSRYYWPVDHLAALHYDSAFFPPPAYIGQVVGALDSERGRALGINQPVPLCSGGLDYIFSLLGTRSIHHNIICDRTGTSHGINVSHHAPFSSQLMRAYPHPISPLTNSSLILENSGAYFIHALRALTAQRALRAQRTASQTVEYTHFKAWLRAQTVHNDPLHITLTTIGTAAIAPPIRPCAPIDDAYLRLESILFSIRFVVDHIRACSIRPTRIHYSGSQANHNAWNQLKADICAVDGISFEYNDSELIGAAAVAWWSLGRYPTLHAALTAMVRERRIYHPRPLITPTLQRRYARFATRMRKSLQKHT